MSRRIPKKRVPTVPGSQRLPGGAEKLPYLTTDAGLVWLRPTRNGPTPTPLTNFHAAIVTDLAVDDGAEVIRQFELEASLNGRRERFVLPADKFGSMNWATEFLGASAVIFPSVREHARVAIQLVSGEIPARRLYGHLGWRKVGGNWLYLHAEGAIGPNGPVSTVEVSLPGGFSSYSLPAPPRRRELIKAIRASLGVLELAPDPVAFCVLAAVYRAVLGEVDLSLHLAGPTGAGKTELATVAQQHFGRSFSGRNLPASWLSTGNSLEATAFIAKDALLVVGPPAATGTSSARTRKQIGWCEHKEIGQVAGVCGPTDRFVQRSRRVDSFSAPARTCLVANRRVPGWSFLSFHPMISTGKHRSEPRKTVKKDSWHRHFPALSAGFL
jgi:hypothetical protein